MIDLILAIPGWLIPFLILLLSVLALGIVLERFWFFRNHAAAFDEKAEDRLIAVARNRNQTDLQGLCKTHKHPVFGLISTLFRSLPADGTTGTELSARLDLELARVLSRFEQGLPLLGTISTIAPLLGLLGTVTGMIKSFHAFGQAGAAKSLELTGGIDEALITTALGLLVAIPSLVAYNYFAARSNRIREEAEGLAQLVVREIEK